MDVISSTTTSDTSSSTMRSYGFLKDKDGRRTYKGYYSWHFTYMSISTSGHRLRCDKLVLGFDRIA